jgi:hypothetical protein
MNEAKQVIFRNTEFVYFPSPFFSSNSWQASIGIANFQTLKNKTFDRRNNSCTLYKTSTKALRDKSSL